MDKLRIKGGIPVVVVGGAWGDEGKGKFVDILSEQADLVIRANGGANAGHTIQVGNIKYDFHLIPSGVLYPNTLNILGSGVLFNPFYFLEELKKLEAKGVSASDKILISEKANLLLPFHIYLDQMEEEMKKKSGAQVGTTKQGIGPANEDMMRRISLRAYHLTNKDLFLKDLEFALSIHKQYLKGKVPDVFTLEYYEDLISEWTEFFKGKVMDTEKIVREGIEKKKRIVVEGAQGALIDVRHGTYPNVTTSFTSVSGSALDAGIPRSVAVESIGIFKAYFSRVGSGGMPTELKNDLGQTIRDKAHEYGVTTGRPRRIGYFDGVAASYSHKINQFDYIVVSCADVVCDLDPKLGPLKICREYSLNGKPTKTFPWLDKELERCKAVYGKEDYGPITGDISKVKRWEDLPKKLQVYLKAISSTMNGTKLLAVGTGPKREDLVVI